MVLLVSIIVHELLKGDTDRRLQFCELILNKCHYSPDTVMKIWSGDANFKVSVLVNRYNCVLGCNQSSYYH